VSTAAAVIEIDSYLNQTNGEALRERVRELLTVAHPAQLSLDFSGTKLVNSIGVSFLLEIIDAAQRDQTPLEFVRVPPDIVELFGLLGITARVPVRTPAGD
jgi:anti-anti-sigma regulatory factor